MSESLLSFSEVLLFGREIDDMEVKQQTDVRLALETTASVLPSIGAEIDGVDVKDKDLVLVQVDDKAISGIYTVSKSGTTFTLTGRATVDKNSFVYVEKGKSFKKTYWKQRADKTGEQSFKNKGKRRRGKGKNNFVGDQFAGDPRLARIYGFSYEGTFYELPEPTIFLVHGKGDSATDKNKPGNLASRAPNDPSLSGVAAADFQIADDILVWEYDKADYTIRMDVMSGQFEQVLLDIYFGFDSPAISGAKVSGAKVSGAKVSGAKVSGAKVSGAKVSGAKARGD